MSPGGPPPSLPADWPLRAHSLSVDADGLRWHVQRLGHGPLVVLLHGTGASTHSWAALAPALAQHATVLVPDLPGHGHTRGATPAQLTLPGMARALQALVVTLGLPPPAALVGHSAGAALGLRWALSRPPGTPMPQVLGFAPSLVAPPAFYTRWLAPLVNPVATSGAVAALTARLAAGTALVDGLLNSTGSKLTPAQRTAYRRLFEDPAHVRGAVGFMAAADLPALLAAAGTAQIPAGFVLGERDAWVPTPALLPVIRQHLPRARVQRWDAGHLLHEEWPDDAVRWLLGELPWVADTPPAGPPGGRS